MTSRLHPPKSSSECLADLHQHAHARGHPGEVQPALGLGAVIVPRRSHRDPPPAHCGAPRPLQAACGGGKGVAASEARRECSARCGALAHDQGEHRSAAAPSPPRARPLLTPALPLRPCCADKGSSAARAQSTLTSCSCERCTTSPPRRERTRLQRPPPPLRTKTPPRRLRPRSRPT